MGCMGWSRRVVVAGFAVALAVFAAPATQAQERDVTIFAAASLKNALDEVAAGWTDETGRKTIIAYAASPALAKQIEQGAPADLFVSADLDWMDYLSQRKLVSADTRASLLGNRLVLIAPKGGAPEISIQPGFPLAAALAGGRLAMANTDAVPAGKYGKAALEKLGVWDEVKDKVAQSENVRAALLLVSRGEAPLGIVYQTDAASDPNVRIVGTFPEDTHPPIVYPVAITTGSAHPDAAGFLAHLRSAGAGAIFRKHGFAVLAKSSPS